MLLLGFHVIRQSATSLIHSIRENPPNLKLLTFEIRDYKPRQCFARGCWAHGTPLSHDVYQIDDHLVKYRMLDCELMPPYAPVGTWSDYCDAKRFRHEQAVEANNETKWPAKCSYKEPPGARKPEPRYGFRVMETNVCMLGGVLDEERMKIFWRHLWHLEILCGESEGRGVGLHQCYVIQLRAWLYGDS